MNARVLGIGVAVAVPLLGLLVANIGRNPQEIRSPLVGKTAPPATLVDLDTGATTTLSSLQGRPVVMNFFASWCVPCHQEHATLVAGARAATDVAFIGVVYDDEPDRARAFVNKLGRAYPSYVDAGGRAAVAYGIYGVPETYFIDRRGVVMAKHVGPLTPETLASYLERLRS